MHSQDVKFGVFKTALALLLLALSGCKESSGNSEVAQNAAPPATQASDQTTGTSTGESGWIAPPPSSGNERGYIPLTNLLFCGETGLIVLSRGQNTTLTWSFEDNYIPPMALSFALSSDNPNISDLGTLTPTGLLSASYQAPASVPAEFNLSISALLEDNTAPAVCRVRLLKDGEIGTIDDGQSRGLVGSVYSIATNTSVLPDLSLLTSILEILSPNLDIPTRSFSEGFPGVPDLFEWFAIGFRGRLVVPTEGTYTFRLNSDDGANLYIDDQLVINNDGVHAPRARDGAMVLTAGNHTIMIDYFQGPRFHIALQLFWKAPGADTFVIIPPDSLLRPQ